MVAVTSVGPVKFESEAGSGEQGTAGAVGLVEAVFEVAAGDVPAPGGIDVAGQGDAGFGGVGRRLGGHDRPTSPKTATSLLVELAT